MQRIGAEVMGGGLALCEVVGPSIGGDSQTTGKKGEKGKL